MSDSASSRHRGGPIRQLRAAAGPWAKTALLRFGGYAALRKAVPSRGLAILRYHAICGAEGYDYADPYICVTPENFERHVAYLTSAYQVMRLEDATQKLSDRQPLPANAVAITFDDGYADNLNAARILAKYGASATFYLTAGCLEGGEPFWPVELRYLVRALPARKHTLREGAVEVAFDLTHPENRHAVIKQLTKVFKSHPVPVRDALREQLRATAGHALSMPRLMLNWDEVREMHKLGMTIGSHTMTHPNLPSAGIERAREELVDSRRRLEHEIDAPVTMFSYPNGGAERYLTPDIQRIVREVGYTAASTSHNSFANESSDIFALERIEVEERVEDLAFALEVERFAFKPVNPAMYR